MSNEDKSDVRQLPVRQKSGEVMTNRTDQFPINQRISQGICKKLIGEAIKMLKRSYVPYSGFHVGAALLTEEGNIYTGCNIENATFTPTNCAERTAFFKAVSEGEMRFTAIAVVGGSRGVLTDYCPPCGVCRQVMMEFCDPNKFIVVLARSEEDYIAYTLSELLPLGFSGKNLDK